MLVLLLVIFGWKNVRFVCRERRSDGMYLVYRWPVQLFFEQYGLLDLSDFGNLSAAICILHVHSKLLRFIGMELWQ